MNGSSTTHDSDQKCKALVGEHLARTQRKVVPLLGNPEYLSRLKKLIVKYETLDLSVIEKILYSKIEKFKPVTQHKIRDFIHRVERGKPASQKPIMDKSDSSNFISPSSRDTFSSPSESGSNNGICNIKNDVIRLWKYRIFQREICQLLYDKGGLEVCSMKSVAIDFDKLTCSTLKALSHYISVNSALLEEILKDNDSTTIFQCLSNENFDDETTKKICDIIYQYENISPNPHGLRFIMISSLKSVTKRCLVKLFLDLGYTITPSLQRKNSASTVVSTAFNRSNVRNEDNNSINGSVSRNNPSKYGTFSKDQLRFLHRSIGETMHDGRFRDVMKIICEYETIEGNKNDSSSSNINIGAFKDITKQTLFEYFTKTNRKTNC